MEAINKDLKNKGNDLVSTPVTLPEFPYRAETSMHKDLSSLSISAQIGDRDVKVLYNYGNGKYAVVDSGYDKSTDDMIVDTGVGSYEITNRDINNEDDHNTNTPVHDPKTGIISGTLAE